MADHDERPPTAVAHGAAKSSDVERVRQDVDKAEACVIHDDEESAARRRRRLSSREEQHRSDAQA